MTEDDTDVLACVGIELAIQNQDGPAQRLECVRSDAGGRLRWRFAQVSGRIARQHLLEELASLRLRSMQPRERVTLPFLAKGFEPLRSNQLAIPGAWHFLVHAPIHGVGGIRWPIKNQRGNALWQAQREIQRDARPLRHAHDDRGADLQVIGQRLQVDAVLGEGGEAGGEAKTTPVVTDDAVRAAELEGLRLPHLEVERPAVDEDENAALPLVAVAQA